MAARLALKRTRGIAVRSETAPEYPREWLKPCLAGETGRIPSGPRWVHEIKFDGYRTQLHLRPDACVIYSRNGHDYTPRYASLVRALERLPARHAVIDAEVAAPFADGRSDFWTLQADVAAGRSERLVAHCFDLLFLDGRDLRALPLTARKAMLYDLLAGAPDGRLLLSEHLAVDGPAMLEQAHALGIEGVISKLADSKYRGERSGDWVKSICQYRETLPVLGYAVKDGRFDGLYVGKRDGAGALVYGGKVEDGFDSASGAALIERLAPFVGRCQLERPPDKSKARWIGEGVGVTLVHRGGFGPTRVRHARFEAMDISHRRAPASCRMFSAGTGSFARRGL